MGRFDELLAAERAAAETHRNEMERTFLEAQQRSDTMVADMMTKLAESQKKLADAQADATIRIQEAQQAAEIQILEAKAGKWRAIEAVKAQCRAQSSDITDAANRAQAEARQWIEQVQAQSLERTRERSSMRRQLHKLSIVSCLNHEMSPAKSVGLTANSVKA